MKVGNYEESKQSCPQLMTWTALHPSAGCSADESVGEPRWGSHHDRFGPREERVPGARGWCIWRGGAASASDAQARAEVFRQTAALL